MGRDRCRRGYFMANKTKNQRSSFFKKLNSERKTTFFLDPKLHDHNLYTEPCTHNLLDIGSEITIDENDMHVSNGWNEGRRVVELDARCNDKGDVLLPV